MAQEYKQKSPIMIIAVPQTIAVWAFEQLDREERTVPVAIIWVLFIFTHLRALHINLLIIKGTDRILTDVTRDNHFFAAGGAFVRE